MIRSFRHKGLQRFLEKGSKSGIQANTRSACGSCCRVWMTRCRLGTWTHRAGPAPAKGWSERPPGGLGRRKHAPHLRIPGERRGSGGLPGLSL